MSWFFFFYFISGFCGLIYEVVWLRLATAQFGVNSAFAAMYLSAFMAWLGLGAWIGGGMARRGRADPASRDLARYAAAELIAALGGVLLPATFTWGRRVLEGLGGSVEWASSRYYAVSGAWIAAALAVPCIAMGSAMPSASAALRKMFPGKSARSYSYLYAANVLGAAAGCLASAFIFVEILGFRRTLVVASVVEGAAAAVVAALAAGRAATAFGPRERPTGVRSARRFTAATAGLFLTGCAGAAMEVIWSRAFSPYLGTFVYMFAGMLSLYLASSFVGAWLHRRLSSDGGSAAASALAAAGLAAVAAAALLDPRMPLLPPSSAAAGLTRLVLSVVPFCTATGFATAALADEFVGGDPELTGRAFAINAAGSMLGPLLAGFALLPFLPVRWAIFALGAPLIAAGFSNRGGRFALALAAAATVCVLSRDFDDDWPGAIVRRDAAATVVAVGAPRPIDRRLFINGIGTTLLTPTTKIMAHLPLTLLPRPPRRGLVICFGMGTAFRSMLSWGIEVTAVELVPDVPRVFGVFHADGPALAASERARVVIDDGRRFLERSHELFDVIVADPPPPEEAAASGLLYSRQFHALVHRHLSPGGIFQQWCIAEDPAVLAATASSLREEFAHVRAFRAISGPGYHLLASDAPILDLSARDLARRMPPQAAGDLVEWGPARGAQRQLRLILARETPVDDLIGRGRRTAPMDDDRPVNEYFLLRRWGLLSGRGYR